MITQKQINTNISRLKYKGSERRLKYWIKQKHHYAILAAKRGIN